jgi:hypothetical protein
LQAIYHFDNTVQSIVKTSSGKLFLLTRKDSSASSLYLSTDSGKHWQCTYTFDDALYNIYNVNDSSLWACGISANLYYSTDNGNTWQKKLNNEDNGWLMQQNPIFRKAIFTPNKNGIIVGGSFYKNGFINFSPSGNGGDWHFHTLNAELHAVSRLNDTSFLIVGYGTSIIFHTGSETTERTDFKGDNLTDITPQAPFIACGYETGIYQYYPDRKKWERLYKNAFNQHWQAIRKDIVIGNNGLLFDLSSKQPIQTSIEANFSSIINLSDNLYLLGDNEGNLYQYKNQN